MNWNARFSTSEKNSVGFAPFTGAWIETYGIGKAESSWFFRTLYGCVNWNHVDPQDYRLQLLRTLYGCVNWNYHTEKILKLQRLRTLYGCVNWNADYIAANPDKYFAPFTGAWIETSLSLSLSLALNFAPFTGAWIETKMVNGFYRKTRFAPFTGAWIETRSARKLYKRSWFAPFTGAWIETLLWAFSSPVITFAPFTGAWIETKLTGGLNDNERGSHPLRVRELKQGTGESILISQGSHPLRVRELKQGYQNQNEIYDWFAPFTGAWIETSKISNSLDVFNSHPLRVRELKHQKWVNENNPRDSHPLRVRELKHGIYHKSFCYAHFRTLYGCVNWNLVT